MRAVTEKQILEWKEELDKQIKTRDQARKVFEESVNNINVLQGGIQFGELLLKKTDSIIQQVNTTGQDQQLGKASSKK